MLRVVRLPDALAEPAPVSLDTGDALDDCVRRDGWLVFTTPFAPRGLWLTRPDAPKLEWISFGRKHAPSLLCDASDLL